MKMKNAFFKQKKALKIFLAAASISFIAPSYAEANDNIQINYAQDLQSLHWESFIPNVKKELKINELSQQVNLSNVSGKIAALTVPADRGTLDVNISSVIDNNLVFVPNVLVFDENFDLSASFGSEHFKFKPSGLMKSDAIEGHLTLTPAIGQKLIYLLIYTTSEDLKGQTQMLAAAKAYASGTGHAIPNIPDPIAKHSPIGNLIIEVTAQNEKDNNVIVGLPIFNSNNKNSSIDLSHSTKKQAQYNTKRSQPILNETAQYFDNQIKNAVKADDIDKALRLLEEAEKLGSSTARDTFVKSVENK
ncbi:maltose operon protein MalM [Thorsellia kenyensis]|uniref:Maltose operon protein MalM n=1 Tax=Thorsellia kenyensis TaxID=1549888 RepID=A0ABV6C9H7_9GAMM